ncbi:MAG: MW1434 family type I TA system toxin [Microvirga sp.]
MGMEFGEALKRLRAGERVSREHWPPGNYLEVVPTNPRAKRGAYFELHQGEVCVPWVATHLDLLAGDWDVEVRR